MSTSPRRMTQAKVVQVYELIKPRIKKLPSGLWEYDPNWSDAKVSEMLRDPTITSNHVAQVRARLFGNIHVAKNPGTPGVSRADQLAAIMATLIRLEAKIDHLTRETGAKPWISVPLNGAEDVRQS